MSLSQAIRNLIYLLLFNLSALLYANKPFIRFEYLGNENGLLSNYTEDIVQDGDGFIWCATDKGISRYDGSEFKDYNTGENFKAGSIGDRTYTLFVDSKNDLWVGALPSGISRYNREKDSFVNYRLKDSTGLTNRVHRIYEDKGGTIWIGSAGGLQRYDQDLDSIIVVKRTYRILSILSYDGYLWLGTDRDGIYKYDFLNDSIVKKYQNSSAKHSLPGNSVHEIKKDLNGNVWVGTSNGGFARYDKRSDQFYNFPVEVEGKRIFDAFTNIYFAKNGYTYLSGDNIGLIAISPNKVEINQYKAEIELPYGFKANSITGIIEDNDHSIWLSTYAGGIYHFSSLSSSIRQYKAGQEDGKSLSHSYVSDFTEDINGNLWIGLDGGGINILNRETEEIEYVNQRLGIENSAITGFFNDKKGNIWASTWQRGYYQFSFNNTNINIKQFYSPVEDDGYMRLKSIMLDSKNRLWTADHFGTLSIYDRDTDIVYSRNNKGDYPEGLFNLELVTSFVEDGDNNIWIVTFTGLILYKESENRLIVFRGNYQGSPLETSEKIYDLCVDNEKNIWFTTNAAVFKYVTSEGEFINFTKQKGLPPAMSILCNKDYLWMATSKGIVKLNTFSETFDLYDDGYSMLGNTFSERAAFETHDGFLCFGGKDGFIMFHPDSIKVNTSPPKVHITRIEVLGIEQRPTDSLSVLSKQAYLTEKIKLKPHQTAITLHFTAVNYLFSEKNKFMYMLEGFDNDWVTAKNMRKVSYMNLNPGNYTFKVKAANSDNVWSEANAELKIYVQPPMYKTIWFRILLILFIIAVLLSIYALKVRNYNRRKKWLESEVDQRTAELNVANNELNERNDQLHNQKEEVEAQRDLIMQQNVELEGHRNNLENLVNRRTLDLERAKNKAEVSDKLKSAFLHNLSHEIRTPLNAIIGFTEILDDSMMDESEIKEAKQIISRSSHNLLDIIDNIIQASLIESDELKVNKKKVDVIPLFERLEDTYNEAIRHEEKPITLKVNIEKKGVMEVELDIRHLEKTFHHFLQNAIKFTEKGNIEFGCELKGQNAVFFVLDTGCGISRKDLGHIFERFRKFDSDSKKFMPGTGLGLAFAKWFVEQHQGEIWVESELDKGTKFTFTIPLHSADNIKPAQKNIQDHMVDGKVSVLQDISNKTVLIAEDNDSNYKYIAAIFRRTKIRVLRARDGIEAVTIFKEEPIDLVLMDLKMPNMDGFEALELIKKINPEMKVVAQTAFVHHESKDALIEKGFDAYIYKPIDKQQLLEMINIYL